MNQTPAKLVEAILLVLKCLRLRLMVTTPRHHKFHSQIKMVRNINIKRKHATIQMQTIFKNTTFNNGKISQWFFVFGVQSGQSKADAISGSKRSLKTNPLAAGFILQICHFWQSRLYVEKYNERSYCPSNFIDKEIKSNLWII